MTFGNRVAKLRDLKGLSQKDLAVLVDTGKDMISRYERGTIMPSIEVAGKIARELGTTLDFLVYGMQEQTTAGNEEFRLQEITKLPEGDQKHIWAVIDAFITRAKLQEILK
ncbi:helix-turn-helix transcriptional regulator [Chitinophaga sp.]|uniref:helix-turn-helix domain-containing protein n=1 Tax=Chitinophaga sp. TaxID=1869181 RepID=UPI0031D5342E